MKNSRFHNKRSTILAAFGFALIVFLIAFSALNPAESPLSGIPHRDTISINGSLSYDIGVTTISNTSYYFASNATTHSVIYGYVSNTNSSVGGVMGDSASEVVQKVINEIIANGYGTIIFGKGTFWFTYQFTNLDRSSGQCCNTIKSALEVGNGSIYPSSVESNAKLNITGQGEGITRLELANNQNCDIIYALGYQSFSITNMTIDGNDMNNWYSVDGGALVLTGGHEAGSRL